MGANKKHALCSKVIAYQSRRGADAPTSKTETARLSSF